MGERTLFYLALAAAIGTGLVGGIFYAFSSFVMTALGRISPEQGVTAMKSINVVVINPSFMTAFMGTGLVCLVLAGHSLFRLGPAGSALVLIAGGLYVVGSIGVTMAFNVPLNNRLDALEPAQAAAFWPRYVEIWTTWNHVRTAASALSSVVFVVALAGN